MKRKHKIIFAAQDPGGFNAIFPVIKDLKKKKFHLKVILAGESKEIAQRKKINYQDGNSLTDRLLLQLFNKESPDLVFTGTSIGESIEKRITRIARIKKIKTCAIIDFWSNYKLRFSNPKTKKLDYLPDYFLVIDEMMKEDMIKKGFKAEKIFITGNPFFDTFPEPRKHKEKEDLITFFSQPFSELFKKDSKEYLGFDEIQVLKDLIKVLERLRPKTSLIVKLHPRDKELNKFDKIVKNSKLNILIKKKEPVEDLIRKSKLVIGMGSAVLFQAVLMGKAVLSYQPNLKKTDYLISNRLGLSRAVYKEKDLCPALKILLTSPSKGDLKLREKYTQSNSTKEVIKFITNFLKK